MILFQLVVNVGMVIGIMPITGIPLPFVTHGGASLISIAVGLGILAEHQHPAAPGGVVTPASASGPVPDPRPEGRAGAYRAGYAHRMNPSGGISQSMDARRRAPASPVVAAGNERAG